MRTVQKELVGSLTFVEDIYKLANIMKMTIATLILIMTIPVHSFACVCSEYKLEELDKESYEWSDLIIIGNIINTGSNYQVEINEVLKGKITNGKIEGLTIGESEVFNNCTIFPRTKGEYLLYLNTVVIYGKTYFYSSECLGSRLLNLVYKPVSLSPGKYKTQLIDETLEWIYALRKKENEDLPPAHITYGGIFLNSKNNLGSRLSWDERYIFGNRHKPFAQNVCDFKSQRFETAH